MVIFNSYVKLPEGNYVCPSIQPKVAHYPPSRAARSSVSNPQTTSSGRIHHIFTIIYAWFIHTFDLTPNQDFQLVKTLCSVTALS